MSCRSDFFNFAFIIFASGITALYFFPQIKYLLVNIVLHKLTLFDFFLGILLFSALTLRLTANTLRSFHVSFGEILAFGQKT